MVLRVGIVSLWAPPWKHYQLRDSSDALIYTVALSIDERLPTLLYWTDMTETHLEWSGKGHPRRRRLRQEQSPLLQHTREEQTRDEDGMREGETSNPFHCRCVSDRACRQKSLFDGATRKWSLTARTDLPLSRQFIAGDPKTRKKKKSERSSSSLIRNQE